MLNKKIFLVSTIVASAALPIIAITSSSCSVDKTQPKIDTDLQKIENIINKVKIKNINVPIGTIPNTSNKATKNTINNILLYTNWYLTENDLKLFTYEKVILKPNEFVPVKTTIKINKSQKTFNLKIKLIPTDIQKAESIKNNIKNTSFSIPPGTPENIYNLNTIKVINESLRKVNTKITYLDSNYFSYSGSLTRGVSFNTINAKITVNNASVNLKLNIKLLSTDQQKADDIKNNITNLKLNVGIGTNSSTINPGTIYKINRALLKNNKKVTTEDLTHIRYSHATLIPGIEVGVLLNITINNDILSVVNLKIELLPTNQQILNIILKDLKYKKFDIHNIVNSNSSSPEDTKIINDALINLNKPLKSYSQFFSYVGILKYGKISAIELHIKINVEPENYSLVQNITLNILTNPSAKEHTKLIIAKIKTKDISINANNYNDIKKDYKNINTSLQNANNTLTKDDLATLDYFGDLKQGISNEVTISSTIDGQSTDTSIRVTWKTDQEFVNNIIKKIGTQTLTIAPGNNVNSSLDKTFINKELKNIIPSLTDDELDTLSYSGTLIPGRIATIINIKSTFNKVYKESKIKIIMLMTDLQKVEQIKNRIKNKTFNIVLPSLNANDAIDKKYIDKTLFDHNKDYGLTYDNLSHVKYNGVLVTDTPATIQGIITINNTTENINLILTYRSASNFLKTLIADIHTINISNPNGIIIPPGTNRDVSKSTKIINQSLTNASHGSIKPWYFEYINYSGTIIWGHLTIINLNVLILGVKTRIFLNVFMNESTPQKISDIIKKIQNTNVVVSGLIKNYNTSDINNIKLMNEAMQLANPLLTTSDLKLFSYSGILVPSKSVTIIVKVTMGNDSATKNILMTVNPPVKTNFYKTEGDDYTAAAIYTFSRFSWNDYIKFYESRGIGISGGWTYRLGDFLQFTSGGSFNGNTSTSNIRNHDDANVLKYARNGGFPYGATESFMEDDHFGWWWATNTEIANWLSIPHVTKNGLIFSNWLKEAMYKTQANPKFTKVVVYMKIDMVEVGDYKFLYSIYESKTDFMYIKIYQYGKLIDYIKAY